MTEYAPANLFPGLPAEAAHQAPSRLQEVLHHPITERLVGISKGVGISAVENSGLFKKEDEHYKLRPTGVIRTIANPAGTVSRATQGGIKEAKRALISEARDLVHSQFTGREAAPDFSSHPADIWSAPSQSEPAAAAAFGYGESNAASSANPFETTADSYTTAPAQTPVAGKGVKRWFGRGKQQPAPQPVAAPADPFGLDRPPAEMGQNVLANPNSANYDPFGLLAAEAAAKPVVSPNYNGRQ